MPLTALHAQAGEIDATLPDLGAAIAWEQIHRVRPRAPLTCRCCDWGLHAKVSPTGLRFFAHDRENPLCVLAGESIAHHLLKLEVASAVRAAGWHAALEVPGDGWRADVLATSPAGGQRMAWEAQLSSITLDDIRTRTQQMTASGLRVCWVTDRESAWWVHWVPSVHIRREGSALMVVKGPQRYVLDQDLDRRRWEDAPPLRLSQFVSAVLSGAVIPGWEGRYWTTPIYLRQWQKDKEEARETERRREQARRREPAYRQAWRELGYTGPTPNAWPWPGTLRHEGND